MPAHQRPPTARVGRLDPAAVAELEAVMARVHALADIPAGPPLAAALAGLDEDRLPGFALTYVMQARLRQANGERGELLATIGRVLLYQVPGGATIARGPDEFAADEVRAGLALTRGTAKRLCDLVWDLHDRLPGVLAAMRAGRLDQPRAQVFSTWTAGLSRPHTATIVAGLLPVAAEMTTGELIDAIAKQAIALDPEWTRRRYERALRGRRVVGRRNPDGTGTLTGHDLPAGEVATACAHLDALAAAAKTAGHPDRLDHLRADLLVGLLTGRYTGLTDQQILTTLLATAPTTPHHDTDHDETARRRTGRRRPGRPRPRPRGPRRRRPRLARPRRRTARTTTARTTTARTTTARTTTARTTRARTTTAQTRAAQTTTARTTRARTTTAQTDEGQDDDGPDDDGPDDEGPGRRRPRLARPRRRGRGWG